MFEDQNTRQRYENYEGNTPQHIMLRGRSPQRSRGAPQMNPERASPLRSTNKKSVRFQDGSPPNTQPGPIRRETF